MRYSKLVISQRCHRSCSLLALSSLRFLSMIVMRLVMLCMQLATSRMTYIHGSQRMEGCAMKQAQQGPLAKREHDGVSQVSLD